MRKKNFLNKVLQNTSCPQGFWGRMILRGMNCFHASLANRGMKQVEWQPEWNVLDIGCGGGANLKVFHSPKSTMQKTWIKDVSYNKGMSVPCLIKRECLMLSQLLKRSISGRL